MKDIKYEYLDERLSAYAESDYYPFHMPGHKRRKLDFENPYKIDVTEIDGFDNLHHAEGILSKAQQRLADLYHSKKSYYLVNGSTGGILSAVGALVKAGDQIVIARNCHKSVYNAVKLFNLKVSYVYPDLMSCGIQGNIDPARVEYILKSNKNVRLVIITSPTYDGIVSDISKISDISHKYNAYLIIDEAHGAHFSFSSYFPESAVRLGADLVVQSLHKTLPCFTQSAALHAAGERVDYIRLEEMLRIFQTSSPSYILMAGMEKCIRMLQDSGKQLFYEYAGNLDNFYNKCSSLKCLHILTEEDFDKSGYFKIDRSKILISTINASINGHQLYQKLLEQYHLQMEMYSDQYVLAMTSLMDIQEGYTRLINALIEIDHELFEESSGNKGSKGNSDIFLKHACSVRKKVLEISEIDDYNIEEMKLENCDGKVCAEYIYLYPPGIPMIVPGEIITVDFIEFLNKCRERKMNVQGTKDVQYRKVLIVAL